MREANSSIPFPTEILTPQNSDLETYLLNLTKDKLPSYNELKNPIQATRIETYANWLSQLTQKDQNHYERGSVVHINTKNRQIIFPSNPNVGNDFSCLFDISKKRETFLPTLHIHTHPEDSCFSHSDLRMFLSGYEDSKIELFVPKAMLVSSLKFNFLILKSQETPLVVDEREVYDKSWIKYGTEAEYYQLAKYGVKKVGSFQPIEDAFNGFWGFYKTFASTLKLAQEYKFGFYYSTKNGLYLPSTKNGLTKVIASILDDTISTL